MSARIIIVTAIFALACSDVAGTQDPGSPCSGAAPTVLFEGLDAYDALTVQDGFVYVEIPGTGVARCAATGCNEPTSVVGSPAFVSAALGSAGVTYTTQIASPDGTVGGEIRSANIDGSADQSLLGGLTYPAYVVKSGNRTFWVDDSFAIDDTPATVNCIGCSGSSSTPWMTGLGGGTYGMIVDATNVYVLADDASLTSVSLLACRIDTPCGSAPRVVIGGLDGTMTAQQIASDGTYVYVARPLHDDIMRVDAMGKATTVLVASKTVTAIAVDAAAGELYFGSSDGTVARVKSGGSAEPETLACSGAPIAALAVDDTNVYLLTGASASEVSKVAK